MLHMQYLCLQLACVQAASNTNGIKHVFTTLIALWKYFHFSPKRAESLKHIQAVLDMPEMKVIKPSNTRWLAHERCVKAVKASFSALVATLESNYENFREPEALGISKALTKFSTIAATFLLDYTLLITSQLNKALQTKNIDFSMVSTLVEATFKSLEDAVTPASNWVLELIECSEDIQKATGQTIDTSKIKQFQDNIDCSMYARSGKFFRTFYL